MGEVDWHKVRATFWMNDKVVATMQPVEPVDVQLEEKRKKPVSLTADERYGKYTHGGYLAKALERDQIDEAVDDCVRELKGKRFDTLVFRGVSGMLVGPIVAHLMHKEVIVIRKQTQDYSHSARSAEGHVAAKRYIILDDFISSGNTCRTIIKEVHGFAPDAQLAGGVFYSEMTPSGWRPPGNLKERVGNGHE